MERRTISRRVVSLYVLVVLALVAGVAMRIAWEAPTTAEAQPAGLTDVTVTRVVDGDTIEVSPEVEGTEDVRLIGVDTPEVFGGEESCGPEASAFTEERLEGEQVGLEFDEERMDPFDRALAYVWVGDELFNETLVAQGLARVDTFPPNDKYEDRFLAAEREARAAGVGLWDPAGPCAEFGTEPTAPTTAPTIPTTAPTTGETTEQETVTIPRRERTTVPRKETPARPEPRGGLLEAGASKAGPVPLMP